MKPRTDAEREAERLQRTVPPLSFSQIRWMVASDRREIDLHYKGGKKESSYYYSGIITRCKGWQIVRYFLLHSTISGRKGYRLEWIMEVSQRWMKIGDTGWPQLVIFEKAKTMCWQWKAHPYSFGSPLSIKGWNTEWNRGGRTQFRLYDEDIYPIRLYDENFVSKCPKSFIGRIDEIELYKYLSNKENTVKSRNIAKSTRALEPLHSHYGLPVELETLIKVGERGLVQHLINPISHIRESIYKYWRSFILARRHGLHLGGLTWADWFEYVRELDILGLDIHSPHYLCPANLRQAHARTGARIQRMRDAERAEAIRKECEGYEATYAKNMGCYFGLAFSSRNILITPIQSVKAMREEGDRMHHCVYTCGYYKRPDSLILSARDKDGNRQETVEVSLRDFTIVQSRGLQNGTSKYHNEIVRTVKKNLGAIQAIRERQTVSA